MTKRQKRIADRIAAIREDIKADAQRELESRPVGFSAIVRLPAQFSPYGPFREDVIVVQKVPSGLEWREYNPLFFYRKGRAEPKWRSL